MKLRYFDRRRLPASLPTTDVTAGEHEASREFNSPELVDLQRRADRLVHDDGRVAPIAAAVSNASLPGASYDTGTPGAAPRVRW